MIRLHTNCRVEDDDIFDDIFVAVRLTKLLTCFGVLFAEAKQKSNRNDAIYDVFFVMIYTTDGS